LADLALALYRHDDRLTLPDYLGAI
jgi:hypothetical protein